MIYDFFSGLELTDKLQKLPFGKSNWSIIASISTNYKIPRDI